MNSDKHKAEEKGKEAEINPENPTVRAEIFVSDSDSQQGELQEASSISSEPDSLVTAGN